MGNKYISIMKRMIVLLSVLLVVVCFSFGVTYSNFIYKSSDHRAVQIVVNKLTYLLKINNNYAYSYTLKPGNNVLNIEVESNNEIDSYYKLLHNQSDIVFYYLDDMPYGRINNGDKISLKLLAINNSFQDVECNFIINGGYLNNSIEDVKEDEGYHKIEKKLSIGDYINYNVNNSFELNGNLLEPRNIKWKLFNINDDGTYEIVSEDGISFDNNICFNGSDGYNNFVNSLNDISSNLFNSEIVSEVRNINLEDIEKVTKMKVVNVVKLKKFNNVYIPSLLRYEKNVSINDEFTNGKLGRSDVSNIELNISNELVNQVLMTEYNINEIDKNSFNNDKYYDLLIKDKKYYLSTRYSNIKDEIIIFGIYSINNKIEETILYNGLNTTNEVCMNIRPLIKIKQSNGIKLEE